MVEREVACHRGRVDPQPLGDLRARAQAAGREAAERSGRRTTRSATRRPRARGPPPSRAAAAGLSASAEPRARRPPRSRHGFAFCGIVDEAPRWWPAALVELADLRAREVDDLAREAGAGRGEHRAEQPVLGDRVARHVPRDRLDPQAERGRHARSHLGRAFAERRGGAGRAVRAIARDNARPRLGAGGRGGASSSAEEHGELRAERRRYRLLRVGPPGHDRLAVRLRRARRARRPAARRATRAGRARRAAAARGRCP